MLLIQLLSDAGAGGLLTGLLCVGATDRRQLGTLFRLLRQGRSCSQQQEPNGYNSS